MRGNLKSNVIFSYLRDGANGLDTPYDMPWVNEENLIDNIYIERRPTRPINNNFQAEISIDLKVKKQSTINFGFIYDNDQSKPITFIVRTNFRWGKSVSY